MRARGAFLALLAVLLLGAAAPSAAVQVPLDDCAGEAGADDDCDVGCSLCVCCPRAPTLSPAAPGTVSLGAASGPLAGEILAGPRQPPARDILHVPWPRPA